MLVNGHQLQRTDIAIFRWSPPVIINRCFQCPTAVHLVTVLKLKLAVSALSIQERKATGERMKAKDDDTSAGYKRASLAQLERMLQALTQAEDRKRRHSVENATIATKEKLLSDQLLQAQKELATVQANKAQLCEEIGRLKQTNAHQANQINKFKLDLQAARESQSTVKTKMEELEASTSMTKQQYIRSLASRIKTSAFVLQKLNAAKAKESSFSAPWENDKPKKRAHIMEGIEEQRDFGDGREVLLSCLLLVVRDLIFMQPKSTGAPAEIDSQCLTVADPEAPVMDSQNHDGQPSASEQHEKDRVEKETLIAGLQAQIAKLESECSAVNDKYKVLECKYYDVMAVGKTSAQEIKAKETHIEELMQELDVLRSKQHDTLANGSATNDEERADLNGRLKMLEENLAQMNGYADQLEMVIAQCPSCTTKMQNESTQDSTTNRVD